MEGEEEREARAVEYRWRGERSWRSEKLLVYWEGGRRTRDIHRLKIEREREKDS